MQDPIGGAQAAGSWAVRETFVAIVVCNLPLVYQGGRLFTKSAAAKGLFYRATSRHGYRKSSVKSEFDKVSRTDSVAPQLELDDQEYGGSYGGLSLEDSLPRVTL